MEKLKWYRNQDREDLNNHIYMGHLSAMTGEDLHSKSEIAQELAVRDMRVEQLEKDNAELKEENRKLKRLEKKAFWWAAEFTHICFGGKIQSAWEEWSKNTNSITGQPIRGR